VNLRFLQNLKVECIECIYPDRENNEVMIKLDPTTVSELIALLKPLMETEEQRADLLRRAFGNLTPLRDQIDCSGAISTFIPKLLNKLARYGEVESGQEALCMLLETIQQDVGLQDQNTIARLLKQFRQSKPLQAQFFDGRGSRYQDLFAVTVGIRDAANNSVGTGIITRGKILTLGRVIVASGALPGDRVNVYLPKANRVSLRLQQAVIEYSFPEREHSLQDDDIVVLSLVNGTQINGVDQINNAKQSIGNRFRIYGFTGLDEQISDYIDGEIVGSIECPNELADSNIDCFKLSPEGTVYSAMAGSGILDLASNLIVGLVARPNYSNNGSLALDGDIFNRGPLFAVLNRESI